MATILFISHDASRSGAPLYLLQFIQWLKNNYEVDCAILLQDGGELKSDFEKLGKVYLWNGHFTLSTAKEKITAKLGYKELSVSYQQRIVNDVKALQPDILISNTIVSNKLAYLLRQQLTCPFVAIYHEMKFSAQFYYSDFIENKFIAIFDKIITVNENIKKFVLETFCFCEEKIWVIPPFISFTQKAQTPWEKGTKKFNILLSGFGAWQKGFDLLGVLLANIKYKKIDERFSFTWLGDIPERNMKMLTFELEQIGASHLITFPGKVKNLHHYYSKTSLFLSLSKEDSFPLSCIEAASYGLPIIAFENSGGIVEFIKKGAGTCVPFLDINEVVNQLILLSSDGDLYKEKAKMAINLSKNYDINLLAPKVVDVFLITGLSLQKK